MPSLFGPDAPTSSGFYWDRMRFSTAAVAGPTRPGAPASLTVSTGTRQPTLTFTWTPPTDDGGSAVTGYTVRVYDSSGSVVNMFTYPAGTTTATETFSYGTTYSPTVTATNAYGESDERQASPSSITTPAAAVAVTTLVTQSAGGFQNGGWVLDPGVHGPGWVFTAGDVGGLHVSSDYGKTWTASNTGIGSYQDRYVRGGYGHPSIPGTAYVLRSSAGQHLFKTVDYGAHWAQQTGSAFGNAAENNNQPRNVGRVGCCAVSNGTLRHYAACGNGLFRSDDDGVTFSLVAGSPTNSQMTGVDVDPRDPTTVLVVGTSVHGGAVGGMWLVTRADGVGGNPVWTEIKHSSTSFTDGEEVCAVKNPATGNTEFHCAMGKDGVWRLERTSSGNNLVNITGPLPSPDAGWDAVCAVPYNGDVLLIVVGGGKASSGSKVWRHKTAGASAWTSAGWFDAVGNGTVNQTINDANGANWWLYAADQSWELTGNQMDVGCVGIFPDVPNSVVIFGRSTPIRCDNLLAAKPAWYPAPVGVGALNVNGFSALPSNPLLMLSVSTDWEWTTAKDGFLTGQPTFKHDAGKGSTWSGIVDATRQAYIGHAGQNAGGTATNGGQVINIPDAWTSAAGSGTDMGFDVDLGVGAGKLGIPKSILALYNGSVRHLIVHFQSTSVGSVHGYLAHKQGTSAATAAQDLGAGNGGNYRSRLVSMPNADGTDSGTAFFYDNSSGLWRTTNWGASWANLYGLSDGNKNGDWLRVVGGVACVPGSKTLYLITLETGGGKVWALPNADTVAASGVAAALTPMGTGIDLPGQIAYSTDVGRLYVAQPVYGKGGARLWQSDTGLTTFTEVTPQGWSSSVVMPVNLLCVNGRLYATTDGQGVWSVQLPL